MINDSTKLKYEKLLQSMYKLQNNFNEIYNLHNKLISDMEDTIKLDKQIIKKQKLKEINDKILKDINTISSTIIPSINSKK